MSMKWLRSLRFGGCGGGDEYEVVGLVLWLWWCLRCGYGGLDIEGVVMIKICDESSDGVMVVAIPAFFG